MSDFGQIIGGNGTLIATSKAGTTVQTFAISLAAGFVLFGVQFSVFVICRNYLWAKRIYQPRSFLVPLKNRVKPPPNNLFKWIVTILTISTPNELLHKSGMDAYFFLRYLRMGLMMFLPIALTTIPILIPLNIVDGKSTNIINGTQYNVTGMDVLGWGNVSPAHTNRYWAHLILAIAVIAWTCYLFYQELMNYIVKRQAYLGSPSHRLKASSTTVLITDIPSELCTTEALTELYDDFPGGVRRMWINKDFTKLAEKDQLRKKYEDLLENAQTDLVRIAVKKSRKLPKSSRSLESSNSEGTDGNEMESLDAKRQDKQAQNTSTKESPPKSEINLTEPTPADCQQDLEHDIKTKAAWTQYINPKERETMRIAKPHRKAMFKIPLVGSLFGDKVDKIYYCRRQLARLNEEMEHEIEQAESMPANGSAFIQFNTQKAAHLACQAIADTVPRQMLQRTVEMSPADINWYALNQTWIGRSVRLLIFFALFILVILVFGLISFFTGILSQISTVAGSTRWLHWITPLPKWLLSFIQGTLPPVILVLILSGPTPIVLRAMTNSARAAITGSQGERSLQYWYFIFLLLELFIIPTVSSGLTSIVNDLIRRPTTIPNILASNLPRAANYYYSFLVVQALSISASSICQTVRMFNYYVVGKVNTPDAVFAKLTFTHFTRIGSNIPWYTTFIVIGLVYCVIAPLMSLFMILTFGLFWIVIKNNVLFVVRTGGIDSGGLWFPHAITQTFTGLYFMEVCLVAMFFLVRDTNDDVACDAQGIIMAVVLVLTVLYQVWLMNNFRGLIKYAPLRLETMAAQQDKAYELERLAPHATEIQVAGKNPDKSRRDTRISQNTQKVTSSLDKETSPPPRRESRLSQSTQKFPNLALDTELSPPDHDFDQSNRRLSNKSLMTPLGIIDRSKDMEVQKEHDSQRAKGILARLNRPLDEARLASLESSLAAAEVRIGNLLLPRSKDMEVRMMNDPISKIIMQHNDELEDLTAEERDMLISVAFTHPVLRATTPTVWIPRDELGVSDDEIKRMRGLSKHLSVDNRGAFFNRKLKVNIDRAPPDMSEFALVMAEL